MADRARRNLPYGHFGRTVYSLETEEWQCERQLATPQDVWPLDSGQRRNQHDVHQPSRHEIRKEPQARRIRRQINDLVKHIPELQPAVNILPGLLRVSEAAQSAIARHDSTQGALLSITNIRSNASHKPIRVAASPSGPTRSTLRLSRVQEQKRGWAVDKTCWINVPSLYGEETLWTENEGPIQQITFAEPVDRGEPLLGVRLLRTTLIFRPTHTKDPYRMGSTSGLQPNKLYSVDLDATGGNVHADVAFNPWFSQQVAIVDQIGSWHVLEFQSRKLSRIARSWSGVVGCNAPTDGWARIRWVLDLETVAVCTRQSLALFNIAGHHARQLHLSTPEITAGSQWILDFVVLPGHLNYCVLLTSTHLIVREISSIGLQDVKVSTLLFVEHFLNPEIISTRLSAWSDGDDVCILLYTATGRSGSLYRLDLSRDARLRIYEPVEMRLQYDNTAHSILDLTVSPVSWAEKNPAMASGREIRARYINIKMVLSDNTIVEQLSCWSVHGSHAQPSLPTWEVRMSATSARMKHARFVVDDEVDSFHEADQAPSPVAIRRVKMPIDQSVGPKRSIELVSAAQGLLRPVQNAQCFERLLGEVTNSFHTNGSTIIPMRTLESLLPADLVTKDIESVDIALDSLTKLLSGTQDDIANEQRSLELNVLASPPATDLASEVHSGSASRTHDTIVAGWITSLSGDISGRVRLAKLEIARKVATELIFASRIIRAHNGESLAVTQGSNGADAVAAWDLPVRASGRNRIGSNFGSLDMIQASQYSAFPTPSPSATPSVVTMSTGISGLAAPQIFRLSGLVSFNKPSPSVLSRPMSKILSHWRLGESPGDYDWQSKSKHLQREEEDEEEEEMTEKERKRLHRRAERHIRRQRKEAEASQAQQMASSQAPEITTASQPAPMSIESPPVITSSQPSRPRIMATSQVVLGRFGGRPPKKKRKSGF